MYEKTQFHNKKQRKPCYDYTKSYIINYEWQSDCPSRDDLELFLSKEYPKEEIEDIHYEVFQDWLCD